MVTGKDNMKTFRFESETPNLMDPYLMEHQIKFVRERNNETQYTYLIDLSPFSPHIETLKEFNELLEINQMPDQFKKKLLAEREPINNPMRPRDQKKVRGNSGSRELRGDNRVVRDTGDFNMSNPDQACFRCGQPGHLSRDCPNESTEKCYKCGQRGHIAKDCDKTDNDRSDNLSNMNCYNCGQEGHLSRDCPEPKAQRYKPPMTCYNCGEEGHSARDCPEPRSERSPGTTMTCYNCG